MTKVIDYGEKENVHDMDICSSYPDKMANYTFATMMSNDIKFLGLGHFEKYVDKDNFRLN